MDLNNLWIGDSIRIISRDLIGRFGGIHSAGMAFFDYNNEQLLVSAEDIELYTEAEPSIELTDLEPEPKHGLHILTKQKVSSHVIDLHYQSLEPERFQSNPHDNILEFQLTKCREFIQNSLNKRLPYIQIIHGKGQGILKAEVEHQLRNNDRIRFYHSTPDGGGLEIYLK